MKEGWEIKKLGEVCTINPPKKEAISKVTSNDMVSFLPMEDLDIKAYYTEPKQHRLFSDVQSSYTYFTNGDVLLAKVTPCFENGKIGIAHNLINSIGFGSSEFLVFRIKEAILKEFLYYYLQNKTFVKEAIKNLTGSSGLRRVPKTFVENSKIPVPSIAEQEKIVAELDCLSGIIEKKKQQLKEYDALAQSIFYEMFGNSNDLVPLSYYIDALSAGKSLAGDEECSNKVLKTGAVTYDYFDRSQVKNLPLEYEPQQTHKVKAKDVLISRMNTVELVGACAYVWNVDDSTYLPDRLWRAEIKDNSNPIYLWKAITTDKSKEQIRNYASGTSGSMKNISKSSFLKIQIPKVALLEQQEFASKIEAIEKQKALIKKSIEEVETLFNSRMDEYFN